MKYLVVGCGGLGCYIVENLMRMGAEEITVCDGDIFSESNMNRQLYCTEASIGRPKVEVAAERARALSYSGCLISLCENLTRENAEDFLDGIDIAFDALDNTESRFILEDACEKLNIPLIHGAVGEYNYQVAVVMPESKLLHRLYDGKAEKNSLPTYAFTVQSCAAAQTAEALKLEKGEDSELRRGLLIADLKTNSYDIVNL